MKKLHAGKNFLLVASVSLLLAGNFVISAGTVLAACSPPYTKETFNAGTGMTECSLPDSSSNSGSVTQTVTTYGAPQGQSSTITTISLLIARIQTIINLILPFIVSLAVFVIIYGIFGYITTAEDEERRKEAKSFILWGVVGVFLMLSVWGLVTILYNSFSLNNSSAIIGQVYTLPPGVDANASLSTPPTDLLSFINRMNVIGAKGLFPLFFSIATFIVIYGIFNYIRKGDNEEKRAEGRAFIIWGIVSIFIMLSIWGMVNILVGSFGLTNSPPVGSIPKLPTVQP